MCNIDLCSSQNFRQVYLSINHSSSHVYQDSLPIFPLSVKIISLPSGKIIPENNYEVSGKSISIFNGVGQISDTAYFLQYRVLDNFAFKPLRILDTTQISNQKLNPFLAFQFSENKKNDALGFGNLNYRGSISRSILTGNNQDLSLNSTLNLQFSGKIDAETEIAAVITDNNIPIQPDGATRQIQEFDKIYIQVKRKNTSLLAGDYEISGTSGYFMKYYKKLRGATITNRQTIGTTQLDSKASFAISRGKFSRMIINGIEGNQGPYKLNGSAGESFIIILSGSEKVFLDGMVLQRGLQDDYTIDYNRGDISFTPKRMITKDSRIIIEFEYVVQNYVRSIITLSETLKVKKSIISVNAYTEQDSKNTPGALDLSQSEKLALAQAGDNTDLAIVQSLDTSNSDPIKYRLVDSLGVKGVLVYSVNNPESKYTASFAFVGNGNGDYILDSDKGVNGRIFKWVAPGSNGAKNGNYAPIKKLIAPTIQQMATISVQTPFNNKIQLSSELALTRFDKNRFSALDSKDDSGFAGKIGITRVDSIGKKTKKMSFKTFIESEYISKYFKPLNPYRNAEFNRDYNYKSLSTQELWINSGFIFSKGNEFNIKYLYNNFSQSNLFSASKHDFNALVNKNGWVTNFAGSILTSTGQNEITRFLRPKYEISKSLLKSKDLTTKVFIESESNERKSLVNDTLLSASFRFIASGLSLAFKASENLSSTLTASHRIDDSPLNNKLTRLTVADQLSFENNFKIKKFQSIQFIAQYRNLKVVRDNSNFKNGDNYLGRLQHSFALPDGSVSNLLSYEIGSGQEQKIDFYYQEVNPGLGQYEYNDYNGDGIKQLDEFEIATNIDKAKFIRLIVLSNEFVQTDNISFNENLTLGFPTNWSSENKIKKALQKITLNTSLQLNRKLKNAEISQIINPFSVYDETNQLALLNYFYSGIIQVNRGKPGYELQFGVNGSSNRQLLTSGLEGRTAKEYYQFTRVNLNPKWQFENKLAYNIAKSEAELFASRNYLLHIIRTEPAVIVNSSLNTRIAIKGKWENGATDVEENGITSNLKQVSAEIRHNANNRSSVNARLAYTDIKFTGNQSSPAGFSLLQGLNNGKNIQMNLDIDYRITKKLYLVVGYEGRKLGISKIVHVFRTQLKAEF